MEQTSRKCCSTCHEDLPLDAFGAHRGAADGKRGRCKFCRRKEPRDLEASRRWYRENKVHAVEARRLRMYGVSGADYRRMEEAQGGKCLICNNPPMGRGKADVLVVDHDHTTGVVRGLLCGLCNMGLGKFQDNPAWLERAADYIRGR